MLCILVEPKIIGPGDTPVLEIQNQGIEHIPPQPDCLQQLILILRPSEVIDMKLAIRKIDLFYLFPR